MWLKFKEWADIHGPIYQTSAGGQTFVIISDEKIAEELLVKRGHIYSGRPQIRSLIKHKDGPVYVALQDRHGTSNPPPFLSSLLSFSPKNSLINTIHNPI